jgi:hypothetical protein
MAHAIAGRVKQTTTTTGTGTISLDGTSTGFRTFVAGIGDGNVCHYCITDGTDFEVGVGTVTDAATDTLSRDTVLYSSNGGNKVNWGAGTKDVFATWDGGVAAMRGAIGLEAGPGVEISGSVIRATVSSRTLSAATTLVNSDRNKLFNCSGQFTVTLSSANALDANWSSRFKNSGSSTVTLSAVSLIDGISTLAIVAGADAEILNLGSTFTRVGPMLPATQSQMEAYSSTGVFVTPANLGGHPGVAKQWCEVGGSLTPASVLVSHNTNSVTDNGTGDYTVNFSTAFTTANYSVVGTVDAATGSVRSTTYMNIHTKSTSSLRIITHDGTATQADAQNINFACFGDQ